MNTDADSTIVGADEENSANMPAPLASLRPRPQPPASIWGRTKEATRAHYDDLQRWENERTERILQAASRQSSRVAGERPPLNEIATAIAELVFRRGPLTAKSIVTSLPQGKRTSEDNVRRIFAERLTRHYGFSNRRDGRGYRPPPRKTW